jgi:hypothetical protein
MAGEGRFQVRLDLPLKPNRFVFSAKLGKMLHRGRPSESYQGQLQRSPSNVPLPALDSIFQ